MTSASIVKTVSNKCKIVVYLKSCCARYNNADVINAYNILRYATDILTLKRHIIYTSCLCPCVALASGYP